MATVFPLDLDWEELDCFIENLRNKEFSNLKDVTYLDHTGATIYGDSQLKAHFEDLSSNLYGNPHSQNSSSQRTLVVVEQIRDQILHHFNTDSSHYDVIFTNGCTGALKLLADVFPWESSNPVEQRAEMEGDRFYNFSQDGHLTSPALNLGRSNLFCYLQDNHTSVVGVRDVAIKKGGVSVCVSPDIICSSTIPNDDTKNHTVYGLFAYPAMSNFSGTKYPLEWINCIHESKFEIKGISTGLSLVKWFTLLDAAAFVATNELDLSVNPADFVTLSFYKIFGYPTGLGALLVRNEVSPILHTVYFGGGTVDAYASDNLFHVPRGNLHERLEYGTLPFLDILSLRHGFSMVSKVGGSMRHIAEHTFRLARLVYSEMKALRHHNDLPVCQLYCHGEYKHSLTQGGIVNFNILDDRGNIVGYNKVNELAIKRGIHLRTGCFCNTGACQIHLDLAYKDIIGHLEAGHVCGDSLDIVNGKPTGSVRISFGYMSTRRDAESFLQFVKDCFVLKRTKMSDPVAVQTVNNEYHLLHAGDTLQVNVQNSSLFTKIEKIALYPVKSCRAFVVEMWPLSSTGFLYDREWAIVGQNGAAITQKHNPKLCAIQPSINLEEGTLRLTASGFGYVCIQLVKTSSDQQCDLRICGERVCGLECSHEVSEWLTTVLGTHCKLIQQDPLSQRISKVPSASKGSLSFANRAQYLLITQSSVEHLHHILKSNNTVLAVPELIDRFRANLVVSGNINPFIEDTWEHVTIGDRNFDVCGQCVRCQMICIDQESGCKEEEPLKTLFSLRGNKAHFGVYLSLSDNPKSSHV